MSYTADVIAVVQGTRLSWVYMDGTKLSNFLVADDGGFITVRGHRIGLVHVIRVYEQGYSPEMIWEHYPTLPLALIHKVIAFYLENRADVESYIAEHDKEIERQMALPRTTPTLAELKQRMEARRRAGGQSLASVSAER